MKEEKLKSIRPREGRKNSQLHFPTECATTEILNIVTFFCDVRMRRASEERWRGNSRVDAGSGSADAKHFGHLNEIRIECGAALDDAEEIVDGLFFAPSSLGRHGGDGLSKRAPRKCKKGRRARRQAGFSLLRMIEKRFWKWFVEQRTETLKEKGVRCYTLCSYSLPRPSVAAFFNMAPKHPFLVTTGKKFGWVSQLTLCGPFDEGVLDRIVDILRRFLVLWLTVEFNPMGSWSIQNHGWRARFWKALAKWNVTGSFVQHRKMEANGGSSPTCRERAFW